MAGWHHRLNGREFESTPGVGDRQGALECCDSWGRKSWTQLSDWTELNWTLYTNINSKWIKDLNVRLDTIKLLEEYINRILFNINQGKIFFALSPRVMKIKTKINKWDLIKLKSFCIAEETINKMKKPSECEKNTFSYF